MNSSFRFSHFFACILSILFLAGCSSTGQEAASLEPTQTAKAIPTNTSIPPTKTPELPIITFEVQFDGEECSFTGPNEVPVGYTNIGFDNKWGHAFGPWVDHFLDGKTFEDFLDEVHMGSDVSHPKPDWVKYASYHKKGEDIWRFNLDEPGEYAIFVGSYTPWQEYPCGEFRVK
jgi:hypothetical protein